MFNAPRRTNPSLSQSAFFQSSTSNSNSNTFDPLAASSPNVGIGGGGFGDVDPWSGMASPARAATPSTRDQAGTAGDVGSAETTPVAANTSTMPSHSPQMPSDPSVGLGIGRRESDMVIMPSGMEDGYTRLPGAIRSRAGDGLKELIGKYLWSKVTSRLSTDM
jgi:hypothetical protein